MQISNDFVRIVKPSQPRSTAINTASEYKMPTVDLGDFRTCEDCGAALLSDCEHKCYKQSVEQPYGKQVSSTLLSATERKAVSGIPTRLGWQCGLCGASNSPDVKQCPCKIGEAL